MVKIRLARAGRKKLPLYRIVAADSRARRDGSFIEILGQYNPLTQPATVTVKEPRVIHWLKSGAQPTDTVRSLLRKQGVLLRWNLVRKGKDAATIDAEMEKWQLQQQVKVQRLEARHAQRRAAKKAKAAAPAAAPAAEAPAAEAPAQA